MEVAWNLHWNGGSMRANSFSITRAKKHYWDKFIYDLSVYVVKLTSHYYASVHQSRALKEYKENVAEGKAVVTGDFSESYTFII